MTYTLITNPSNGKTENINSLFGKQILSNYLSIVNADERMKSFNQLGGTTITPALYSDWAAPSADDIEADTSDRVSPVAEDIEADASECCPEILCPLTLKIMVDPVITRRGNTYERHMIEKWFRTNRTDPLTNIVLTDKVVIPNIALKQRIGKWIIDKGYTSYWDTHRTEVEAEAIETGPGVAAAPPTAASIQLTLRTLREDLRNDLSQRDAIHGLPMGARRGVPGFLVYDHGVDPARAFADFERDLVRLDQAMGGPGSSYGRRMSLDYWRETLAIMMELAYLLRVENAGDAARSPLADGTLVIMAAQIDLVRSERRRREEVGGFTPLYFSSRRERERWMANWDAANARPDSVEAIRQLMFPVSIGGLSGRAQREVNSIRLLGQRRVLPEVGPPIGSIDYTDDLYSSSDEEDELDARGEAAERRNWFIPWSSSDVHPEEVD